MKLIQATIQDFKRISICEITPDGNPVEITGANAQGKSSLLESIKWGFTGKESPGTDIVRKGSPSTKVLLTTDTLTVERVKQSGATGSKVVIKNRTDNSRLPSPQAKLDSLSLGGLAFDPLAFMSLKPTEQRETLLRAIGVDLSPLTAQRLEEYEGRTVAGRELRAAEARLAACVQVPEDTPDVEVSIASLTEEFQAAHRQANANSEVREREHRLEDAAQSACIRLESMYVEIKALADKLDLLKRNHQEEKDKYYKLCLEVEKANEEVNKLVEPDLSAIAARIDNVESTNRNIRAKRNRDYLTQEVLKCKSAVDAHSEMIATIDSLKVDLLQSTPMPVDGLTITDDGILFNGVPVTQASTAESVRLCVAIAAALNPELSIALIKNGNDLDSTTLKVFYEECAARGLQPFVERIVASRSDAIEIEEGIIK